jgi:ribosome-binding protein aMBF1 (putative translation factor)
MSQRSVSSVGTSVEQAQRDDARASARYRRELERLAPYERLARTVVRLRMDQGLTQGQLAAKTGTTASAIARLEAGRHKPNVETLRKIAHAYGGRLVLGIDIPAQRRGRSRPELVSL